MNGAGLHRSAPFRVLLILLALVLLTGVLVASLLMWQSRRAGFSEAERITHAVAETVAVTDEVIAEMADGAPDGEKLQQYVERELARTGLGYVVIMRIDGTRITHRDRSLIGGTYVGTIPDRPATLTERHDGSMGPTVRTIVPLQHGARQVGWVSVGVTVDSVAESIRAELPLTAAITGGVMLAGTAGALLGRGLTRRVTGDRSLAKIRDELATYESLRTMGQALRAQTHEHGNRMHTAVALIELGRSSEAVALLTESSRQSQLLVDEVAQIGDGDPVLGALLLGKSAEARERGILLTVEVPVGGVPLELSDAELVSVVGNLLDNALDAAGAGSEPRRAMVRLAESEQGRVLLEVSDTGEPVERAIRDRIFEAGVTSKTDIGFARGYGLPLVREIVIAHGGTIEFREAPTTFTVTLPGGTR